MLNYIRAELYKVAHRRYFYGILLVILALEALMGLLILAGALFQEMVGLLGVLMGAGVFFAVLCADLVCSDFYKAGTLKNEVSFGIPRSRIYLGKLFAALLVALLLCAVILGCYLGGSWLFAGHGDPAAEAASLAVLAWATAASFPLWLGALGLSHCLFTLMKNTVAVAVCLGFFLAFGSAFFSLLADLTQAPVRTVAGALSQVMLMPLPDTYSGALTRGMMGRHWAVGLGWFALSTTVGLMVLRRREL